MYRNILWDLDNTILDFDKAERAAFDTVIAELGVGPTQEIAELYSRINLSQWKLLELGRHTLAEIKRNRYRLLFEAIGIDASPEDATARFEELLGGRYDLVDGAKALLQELYGKYRLYIASNGTLAVQKKRIAGADIARYFDGVFISQELGANKPDTAFFDGCFERIPDFSGAETVIVGDSLTSDILGGNRSGIDTVWFNPKRQDNAGEARPTYEIHTLEEIKSIL